MFDLGWTELLVIGIVALIVVGPKDLPGMFRTVGNFVGKAKRMARDFSRAMNEAADEAGMSDVKRSLDAATNPMKTAMDEARKSTEGFTARTMAGPKPKTEPDPERDEMVEKIRKRTAEVGAERLAKEAEAKAAATAESPAKTPAKPAPAKKPAAKKPASAKAGSTKTTAKKPAAKKPAAAKAASGKPATTKAVDKPASGAAGKAKDKA